MNDLSKTITVRLTETTLMKAEIIAKLKGSNRNRVINQLIEAEYPKHFDSQDKARIALTDYMAYIQRTSQGNTRGRPLK